MVAINSSGVAERAHDNTLATGKVTAGLEKVQEVVFCHHVQCFCQVKESICM